MRQRSSRFSGRSWLLPIVLLLFGIVGGCVPTPTPTLTPTPVPGPAPAATSAPAVAWSSFFGTPGWDRANGVAVDTEGNIIVAGALQGALPGQTRGGIWDAYIRKLSPAGVELWTRQFTNTVSVGVLAVAVDGTGNVIAAGHVQGALPGQTHAGVDDAYVRKFSPAGVELWTHQFGTPAAEQAFGVAADASGNIIVVGSTEGALPGQTRIGVDKEDAFVRKYSPAGVELWTRQFGTTAVDRANGVVADMEGNIIVAGRTEGDLPGQTNAGSWDVFVRKYSPAGVELWTRQFGSSGPDEAFAVVVDRTGNIIAAGHAMGTLPGQTHVGFDDAFVQKLSPAGTELWTRQFGSPRSTQVFGAAVDGAGDIFVAGATSDALPGQKQVGAYDGFVREYSPAGVDLWTRQFASSSPSVLQPGANASTTILPSVKPSGVGVDGRGQVVVVGDANGDMFGQTIAGNWDAFIIAWAPS